MPARWNWPAFRCVALTDDGQRVCQLQAKWRANPLPKSRTWWTYCDRHKPEGAYPIPLGARFHVTRITVTVAIASLLERRQEASDEAARTLTGALEDIGAALVHLRVHGGERANAKAKTGGLRMTLAGPRQRVTAAPWEPEEDPDRPVWLVPERKRMAKARWRAPGTRSTAAAGNGTSAASTRPRGSQAGLNGSRRRASGE